jgi:hypothetical protein
VAVLEFSCALSPSNKNVFLMMQASSIQKLYLEREKMHVSSVSIAMPGNL